MGLLATVLLAMELQDMAMLATVEQDMELLATAEQDMELLATAEQDMEHVAIEPATEIQATEPTDMAMDVPATETATQAPVTAMATDMEITTTAEGRTEATPVLLPLATAKAILAMVAETMDGESSYHDVYTDTSNDIDGGFRYGCQSNSEVIFSS